MTDEKRARATEWRVTRNVAWWKIRIWVESAQEFGGIPAYSDAEAAVASAIAPLTDHTERGSCTAVGESYGEEAQRLARLVLDASNAFNSVEVCDSQGCGACIHRDWP